MKNKISVVSIEDFIDVLYAAHRKFGWKRIKENLMELSLETNKRYEELIVKRIFQEVSLTYKVPTTLIRNSKCRGIISQARTSVIILINKYVLIPKKNIAYAFNRSEKRIREAIKTYSKKNEYKIYLLVQKINIYVKKLSPK